MSASGRRASLPNLAGSIAVVALVLFQVGSYGYFLVKSRDYVIEARSRSIPQLRLGEPLSWKERSPGALSGWWPPAPEGTWSVGRRAVLEVTLAEDPPAGGLLLRLQGQAFLHPPSFPGRRVDVLVNGIDAARWEFVPGPAEKEASIPRSAIPGRSLRIELRMAEDPSPVDLGVNADYRRLGILVTQWRISAPD